MVFKEFYVPSINFRSYILMSFIAFDKDMLSNFFGLSVVLAALFTPFSFSLRSISVSSFSFCSSSFRIILALSSYASSCSSGVRRNLFIRHSN